MKSTTSKLVLLIGMLFCYVLPVSSTLSGFQKEIRRLYLMLDGELIAVGAMYAREKSSIDLRFEESLLFKAKETMFASSWVFVGGFGRAEVKNAATKVLSIGKIRILAPEVCIQLNQVEFVLKQWRPEGLPTQHEQTGSWILSPLPIHADDVFERKQIIDFGFDFDPYPLIEADAIDKYVRATNFEERLFIFQGGRLKLHGKGHFDIESHRKDNRDGDATIIELSEIEEAVLGIELEPTFWSYLSQDESDSIVLSDSKIAISSRHLCCVTDQLRLKRSKSGRYNIDPSQIESLIMQSREQGLVKKNIPFFYKKDCIARGAFMLNSREIIVVITVTSLLLLMVTVVFRRWSNKRKLKHEEVAKTVGL